MVRPNKTGRLSKKMRFKAEVFSITIYKKINLKTIDGSSKIKEI